MGDATHDQLATMWRDGHFEPQIHHIRFPRLKNLEPNLRIDFRHPVTAIVGPNGTNKSTVLRALQSCPNQTSLETYWFGTALDDVLSDKSRGRPRYIHGRWSPSAESVVEAQKLRIQRRPRKGRDRTWLDYFEPTRPIARDGMEPIPPVEGSLPADRSETAGTQSRRMSFT